MTLLTLHRILIRAAAACAALFAAWSVYAFLERGAASQLALGAVSAAVGVALLVYLKLLRRKLGGRPRP